MATNKGKIHLIVRPNTFEILEKLKEQEKNKRFYNVTNDVLIREGLELLQRKLAKAN